MGIQAGVSPILRFVLLFDKCEVHLFMQLQVVMVEGPEVAELAG